MLEISEARVNQHVATIKRRLGVNDLVGIEIATDDPAPSRYPIERKTELPVASAPNHLSGGSSLGPILFSDATPLTRPVPWEGIGFRVGPEALEGPGAGVKRAAFVVLVALSLPVLLILTATAMVVLTQVR